MEIRGVAGSCSKRPKPSPMSEGSTLGALVNTSHWLGASTVSWNVAFWSGCSALAYMRRASAASNCV